MNAFKCDICGKYFENSKAKTGSPWHAEETAVGYHKITLGLMSLPDRFLLFDGDICPECMGYFCVGLCERGCQNDKVKMYAADYISRIRNEMRTQTLGVPVGEEAKNETNANGISGAAD